MTLTEVFPSALLACMLFLAFSFLVNRLLRGGWPRLEPGRAVVHAALVFSLAVVFEVLVNSAYERLTGSKLWEYRVLPARGGDVSLLAPLVWPVYGLHLYWLRESLSRRFGRRGRSNLFHALLVGFEAPFVFEVVGNLLFILLLGSFYAWYVPDDFWHLTSLRVVPAYMLGAWTGFRVLDYVESRRRVEMPILVAGFVVAGFLVLHGPGA